MKWNIVFNHHEFQKITILLLAIASSCTTTNDEEIKDKITINENHYFKNLKFNFPHTFVFNT